MLSSCNPKGYKSEVIKGELEKAVVTDEELNIFSFSSRVRAAYKTSNDHYDALIAKYDAEKNWGKKGEQYQYKIYGKPHTLSYELAKKAGKGFAKENAGLLWWLTFGLGIIGALLFILPNFILLGKPGIKNKRNLFRVFYQSRLDRLAGFDLSGCFLPPTLLQRRLCGQLDLYSRPNQ